MEYNNENKNNCEGEYNNENNNEGEYNNENMNGNNNEGEYNNENMNGNNNEGEYNNENNQDDTSSWGTLEAQESQYFNSYAHLGIHEEMLKDYTRTISYKRAITCNPDDFKDKIVLDVGCGTGVLAIFCAKSGAKHVYAVDASDVVEHAIKIIAKNNLSHKITVMKGMLEDLVIPEKVDIIVSEWMGYFLIYEAMLKTVFFARDNYLKPDGLLYPCEAQLYLAAYSDPDFFDSKVEFWRDVYGVDMSPLMPIAQSQSFNGAAVDSIRPDNVASNAVVIKTINCETAVGEDLDNTTCNFEMICLRTGPIHGFVGWFDVTFKSRAAREALARGEKINSNDYKLVVLSTDPIVGYTHWHQTIFTIENPIYVEQGKIIQGTIYIQPQPQAPRHLAITIHFTVDNENYYRYYDF
eukprot:TRINITY_DN96_c0_g2_i1.p1 TRINITY_DN96_c0_g2~~TRINITY_DN96_c0_g2_i1.p1  ORF type:complete len:409 (+),score=181.47 TRINITY_DN96_c0_g2_i1:240-1466(+)